MYLRESKPKRSDGRDWDSADCKDEHFDYYIRTVE